jgi:hypothetical protein
LSLEWYDKLGFCYKKGYGSITRTLGFSWQFLTVKVNGLINYCCFRLVYNLLLNIFDHFVLQVLMVYTKICLSIPWKHRICIGKVWKVFYSIMIKWNRNREEIEWLNVQNAEQKFQRQKRLGKWLVVQIKLENACN